MKSNKLTIAAFIITVLFLGVNYLFVKISNKELSPLWGASLRYFIASIILFIIVRSNKIDLPTGKALTGAVIYGVLSFGMNAGLLYWALNYASSSLASIIYATTPLTTLIITYVVGQEKPSNKAFLSAILVIIGILVVFHQNNTLKTPILPLIALISASLIVSISGIVLKHYPKVHPISTTAVAMSTGAILLFLCALFFRENLNLPVLTSTWIALSWLIISSTISFALMVWVISQWTATKASYSSVLIPLVTISSNSVISHEIITQSLLVGSLIVILGVSFGVSGKNPV